MAKLWFGIHVRVMLKQAGAMIVCISKSGWPHKAMIHQYTPKATIPNKNFKTKGAPK